MKKRILTRSRRLGERTEGQNRLGLRDLCQRYVDEQWVAAHMTNEQAAEALLDQFKRAVFGELELLVIEAKTVYLEIPNS